MTNVIIGTILVSLLLFVGVVLVAKHRFTFSWKVFWLGSLGFIVGVLGVESLVNALVFHWLGTDHVLFTLFYGAIAAGLFEELARWVIVTLVSKKHRLGVSDVWAIGLGHGGAEFTLVGMMSLVLILVVYESIRSGTSSQLPSALVEQVHNLTPALLFLSVVERILALMVHICLTAWVVLCVTQQEKKYLGSAILIHAGMDLLAGLYQQGIIGSPFLIEVGLGIYVIGMTCLTLYMWKRRWLRGTI